MSGLSAPPPARPRDGPATTFEVDSVMTEILENGRNDDFGLVIVVGWPPNPATLQQPYNALVKAMCSCFDETDQAKSAYFYPLSSLHVTVATLHAFTLETQDAERRAVLEREWRSLVVAASKRLEWPKQPLKLKVDSCQIGSRAGILLWREVTGGLERMRSCIREETMARRDQLENAAISVDSLRIPDIIHSSVLRFPFPVTTDGNVVQERFQRLVLSRIYEMFSQTTVGASTAVLVCERTPYLHHPYDDRHALETIALNDK